MTKRVQLWFSLADLSAMFGFSKSTIRAWWQQGRFGPVGDCIKVGEDIRVPEAGVDFFVLSNRVVRTQESVEEGRELMRQRLASREDRLEREEPQPVPARNERELKARAAVLLSAQNQEVQDE